MTSPQPQVTLTYAQSIDGSITARRGEPMPLSGHEAMCMTHQLRANHDAILIGVDTLLADNPSLTVRLVEGENPQPIVLDSQLRSSADAKIIKRGAWIVTTMSAPVACEQRLLDAGALIKRLPADDLGRVSLPHLLTWLNQQNIATLMVEGGARVIEAFLKARLVDRVIVTVSPQYVGGLKPVANLLGETRLQDVEIVQLGDDVVIKGVL